MNLRTFFLNFLLPPHCPICHEKVTEPHTLCGLCFAKLHFLGENVCSICGTPISKGNHLCGQCLKKKPYFHKAISVVFYDEMSKKLILPYKHADRLELAQLISKWMILRGKEVIQSADCILPVPLHKIRLLKRKYNQSALLGKMIAQKFHKPFMPLILFRHKNTPSQGHLNFKMRQKNIKGAFYIKHPEQIKGKNILLLDDVHTSGATLNECAKVLIKAGAKQVDCLTFCRAGNK